MIDAAIIKDAARDMARGIDAFEESLRVVSVLTPGQRKAITAAATTLVKHCLKAQTAMDIRLVREAFRE